MYTILIVILVLLLIGALRPDNAGKYTAEEVRTIKARIRRASKARKVALPDPDEFVELMGRIRKKGR